MKLRDLNAAQLRVTAEDVKARRRAEELVRLDAEVDKAESLLAERIAVAAQNGELSLYYDRPDTVNPSAWMGLLERLRDRLPEGLYSSIVKYADVPRLYVSWGARQGDGLQGW